MFFKKNIGSLYFLIVLLILTNVTSLYFILKVSDEMTEKQHQEVLLIENEKLIEKFSKNIDELKNEIRTYKQENDQLQNINSELEKQINEMIPSYERWNIFESRYGNISRSDFDRTDILENRAIKKNMRVTAYTEYECDKEPDHPAFGITASGNRVHEWFSAAAGKEIPFGTRLYVPYFSNMENNGIFVVEDRGGAIKENCLDIYTTDITVAKEFGCQWLDVYILE